MKTQQTVWVLVFAVFIESLHGAMPVVNIEDFCDQHFFVDTSVRLHASGGNLVNPKLKCPIFLMSSKVHNKLLVTFRSMDLPCTNAILKAYDSLNLNPNKQLQGTGNGLCGSFNVSKQHSSNTEGVTLMLTTDAMEPGRFDILVTSYTDGECSKNTIQCTNRRCVSQLLGCDGFDNCGDNSDEASCSGSSGIKSATILVFLSVLGIVFTNV